MRPDDAGRLTWPLRSSMGLDGKPGGARDPAEGRAALACRVSTRAPASARGRRRRSAGCPSPASASRSRRADVTAYAAVCGFPGRTPCRCPTPTCWPSRCTWRDDRPRVPLPGDRAVHLENTITAHRAIEVGEDARPPRPCAPRAAPRGSAGRLRHRGPVGGETAWESASTYLRRGPATPTRAPAPSSRRPDRRCRVAATRPTWDAGTPRVSGDRNPIHLYP